MSDQEEKVEATGLPTGWKWSTIAEIAAYVSRGRAPKYIDKDGVPIINQKCVRWSGIEWQHIKFTDSKSAERLANEQFLQDGDVLWNSTGTGTIGRATVFYRKNEFKKVLVDTHVTIVRPLAFEPQLLKLWISSNAVQKKMDRMQAGSTNQVELSRSQVLSTPIPVPPRNEQSRIVAKLDELFSRIEKGEENLKRVQALVKRYRQAILKAAVTGELTCDWRAKNAGKGESGAELLKRILAARRAAWENAELEKRKAKGKPSKNDKWKVSYVEPMRPKQPAPQYLPEGWRWASIEQLCVAERPIAYGVLQPGKDVANGVPLIRVGDIDGSQLDTRNLKRIDPAIANEYPRTRLKGGEVLLTLVGSIGRSAVAPIETAGFNTARAVGVLPVAPSVLAKWLEMWLSSPGQNEQLVGLAHEVARKTLNLEDVRVFGVPLPSRAEQEAIVEAAETRLSIANAILADLEIRTTQVASLRQALLRAAFSGALLPQNPNDEPASALLEHIAIERKKNAKAQPKGSRARKPADVSAQRSPL